MRRFERAEARQTALLEELARARELSHASGAIRHAESVREEQRRNDYTRIEKQMYSGDKKRPNVSTNFVLEYGNYV